jgi:hypothetical protein
MAESKRQFEALSGFAKEREQMSARFDQLRCEPGRRFQPLSDSGIITAAPVTLRARRFTHPRLRSALDWGHSP